jgi:hypothetical protein
MERTYVKQFFGTSEAVETAIRTFDQVFRMRYNVYGGRREGSYKTSEGEYTVIMSYTADWMSSPEMAYLFPEYTAKGIERTFDNLALRRKLPDTADWYFYCDVIKEIPDLEAWRKGK